MLRSFLFLLCLGFISLTSISAQSLQFGGGLGFGSASSSGNYAKPAKIFGYLEARYRLTDRFGVGLELGSAGDTPIQSLAEGADVRFELDPTAAIASSYLVKGLYYLPNQGRFYLALGVGMNRYTVNVHIEDLAKVSRLNFAFQPEIGVQFGGLNLSYKFLAGGKSPDFTKTTTNGDTFTMESVRMSMSFFSIGYLF